MFNVRLQVCLIAQSKKPKKKKKTKIKRGQEALKPKGMESQLERDLILS
jgi:hypothetical protein